MKIITLIFNDHDNECAMLNGSKQLELYTYDEGEIVLSALRLLETSNIIVLEVIYK